MRRLTAILVLLCSCASYGADLQVGQPAPTVEARLLDGTSVRVGGRPGKVTIINFWATWCGPCRTEMPAIQAYYDKHKAQGLEVLAISMDDPGAVAEVRKVAQAYSFSFALKSEASFRGLGRIWRMPSTFVVDRDGVLRRNGHVGEPTVDLATLEAEVTPLLQVP